jgi:hypothetical protein
VCLLHTYSSLLSLIKIQLTSYNSLLLHEFEYLKLLHETEEEEMQPSSIIRQIGKSVELHNCGELLKLKHGVDDLLKQLLLPS